MRQVSIFTTSFLLLFSGLALAKSEVNPLVVLAPQNTATPSSLSVQNVTSDPTFRRKLKRSNQILVAQNAGVSVDKSNPFSDKKNSPKVAINESTLTNSISSNLKEAADAKEASPALSLTAQLGYSQGLYDKKDGTLSRSYDYLLSPSLKVTDNYSLAALISASSDANNRDGTDFGQAKLIVARKSMEVTSTSNILNSWVFSPSIGFGAPASKSARDDQSLLLSLSPSLSFGPNANALGSERFSLVFGLKATRNFHTFEISKSGNSNSQYGASQTVTMGYLLPRDFSLELNLMHFNSWTYQGTANESYGHSQELAYKMNDTASLSVGHQFGAPGVSIYGPDGQTLNLGLANEKYSYIYSNLTLTY